MIDNPKFKSALMGGGVFGLVAALPYIGMLNTICCALYIGGGVLAVYFYSKEQTSFQKAPYGDGAVVGVLAGVIGGIVTTFVGAIVMALGLAPDFSDAAEGFAQLDQMGIEIPSFLRDMATGEVSAAILGTELVVNVILFGIFATVGGLVGVAIFHKKDAD